MILVRERLRNILSSVVWFSFSNVISFDCVVAALILGLFPDARLTKRKTKSNIATRRMNFFMAIVFVILLCDSLTV